VDIANQAPLRSAPAVALAICLAACGTAAADPPASDTQVAESKGGFLSSFRQAIEQDPARDVVRGHFEVGTPPDTHRYYCLVNPKNGKNEENGVRGTPFVRSDGMTGIKEPAVTQLNCADAEKRGLLVTEGYVLKGAAVKTAPASAAAAAPAAAATAAPAASAAPAAAAAAPAAAAAVPAAAVPAAAAATAATAATASTASAAAAPVAATASAPVAATDAAARTEVMAVFSRFVSAQNAHDRSGVSATLLDSPDFVWGQYRGNSIWGTQDAVDELVRHWKGTFKFEPQTREAHLAGLGAGTVVLVVPVLFTQASPGQDPDTVPIRWSGVFVNTKAGWRIAAVFITPFKDWHTPNG
jgi:hypothetical protein